MLLSVWQLSPGSDSLPGPVVVLRNATIRYFIASRFFSGAAATLLRATVAWEIFKLTKSPFYLGLIGLIQFTPVIPFSLLGGAVADSADRRRVMIWAQLSALLGVALLFAFEEANVTSTYVIYGVVFALGVATSLENPSRVAMLPSLVPREQFPAAVTVHSTVMNLSWVTGPMLAGVVIAAAGPASAYALAAMLWASSLFSLSRVASADAAARRFVGLSGIREGLAFVRDHRPVLGAMVLDMFAVIFASVQALLPVYATDILRVGPRGYGVLSSAVELGTLAMAICLLVLRPMQRAGPWLIAAVLVYGAAMVSFGVSRWFPLSVATLAIAGMADEISMVARSAIVQLSTPDHMRGRVSSINMIFIGASNQLGAMESGFVAALTTATFSVVSGGIACIAVLLVVAFTMPELRRYRVQGPA